MTFEQQIEKYLDDDENIRSAVRCSDSVEELLDGAVRHVARDGGNRLIEAWIESGADSRIAAPYDYKAGDEIDIEDLVCEALCQHYSENAEWQEKANEAMREAKARMKEEEEEDEEDDDD
jgi:hypothetical protein